MAKVTRSEKVPKRLRTRFDSIVAITDRVCNRYLNDDYAQLARQATAALCCIRPSPLEGGRVNSWACGIVYALGFVNFLFDKSDEPHLSGADLCEKFGVSQSTGSAKSRVVRDTLDMIQMDPDWCLPSLLDNNPLVWMLTVNGIVVDIRHMPREVQELAYEEGLIPYIPNDMEE